MNKSRIIILALFTIIFAWCTNNQDKQLQQQNDLLKQQNTLLLQQGNQQNANTDISGYSSVPDTTNPTNNDTTSTANTKTIPFNAVGPANNYNTNTY